VGRGGVEGYSEIPGDSVPLQAGRGMAMCHRGVLGVMEDTICMHSVEAPIEGSLVHDIFCLQYSCSSLSYVVPTLVRPEKWKSNKPRNYAITLRALYTTFFLLLTAEVTTVLYNDRSSHSADSTACWRV
jgi:hypothetical protein